jgi:hypothetical protein
MPFSDVCLPQDLFSQTSRPLNGIMFRPHLPNLTQIDQERWQVKAEIYLCRYATQGFHLIGFHESKARLITLTAWATYLQRNTMTRTNSYIPSVKFKRSTTLRYSHVALRQCCYCVNFHEVRNLYTNYYTPCV